MGKQCIITLYIIVKIFVKFKIFLLHLYYTAFHHKKCYAILFISFFFFSSIACAIISKFKTIIKGRNNFQKLTKFIPLRKNIYIYKTKESENKKFFTHWKQQIWQKFQTFQKHLWSSYKKSKNISFYFKKSQNTTKNTKTCSQHMIFNYLIQTETKYIARNLRCYTNIHIYTLFTSLQYLQEYISHNIISNKRS